MADILEGVGTLIWIALAIYGFYHVHRISRRIDNLLDGLAAGITVEQQQQRGI